MVNRTVFWLLVLLPLAGIVALSSVIAIQMQAAPSQSNANLALTLIIMTFFVCTLVLIVWALIDRFYLRPLQALGKGMQIITTSHVGHIPELPQAHLLGDLPAEVDHLATALYRCQRQAEEATATLTQPLEQQKLILETILRELVESVLLCTDDGRILLYNRAAQQLFANTTLLGLGQSIYQLLPKHTLENARRLLDQQPGQQQNGHAEFSCVSLINEITLQCRLARLPSLPELNNTFIITFRVSEKSVDSHRWIATETLPERPEFFDFSLPDVNCQQTDLLATPLANLNYVVFDTETTGLNPSAGDEIIQIAGVRIINGRVVTGEVFDSLVNPGRPIPPASIRFHGISDEQVAGEPDIKLVLQAFARFVGGENTVLVAHNAAFDMRFLKLKETATSVKWPHQVIDTLLLSAYLHDHVEQHSLDAIAARLGVVVTNRHQALGDSLITAHIFTKLVALLQRRGIHTLDDALAVSKKMTALRRQQAQF